ncbi:MAG: hypothetical protein R3B47_07610 [Bacteroidia bacterium]
MIDHRFIECLGNEPSEGNDSLLYEEMAAGDEYSASLRFFDQQFSGIRSVNVLLETESAERDFSKRTAPKARQP